MNQEFKLLFNLVGKEVYKNHKVKGIITAFDDKSVIDIQFEDEPNLIKQFSIKALLRGQLFTEDEDLLDFVSKRICVDALRELGALETYIDDFLKNDTVYLFDGREASKITAETAPELYLKIKGLEGRKGIKVCGAFNVPTRYGEKSDYYVLLGSDLLNAYPLRRQGNVISAVIQFWNIETGESGGKNCRFQLSNGGIWCIPFDL